jgi:hypothetical protein
LDALESDTTAYLFQEQSNLTLTSNVTVGLSDADAGVDVTKNSQLISAVLAAGSTNLFTYTLHLDPVGDPTSSLNYAGSIIFAPGWTILGAIVGTNNLQATDAQLGSPTTTYSNSIYRGFSFTGQPSPCTVGDCDSLTLSSDLTTLSFTSGVSNIDEIRIIATTPEPATLLLAGLALLGVGTLRSKSRMEA